MAAYTMDVFAHTSGEGTHLWAICMDGNRAITCSGFRHADKLKVAGIMPLPKGQSAADFKDSLSANYRAEGYELLGPFRVVDGVVQWDTKELLALQIPQITLRIDQETFDEAKLEGLFETSQIFRLTLTAENAWAVSDTIGSGLNVQINQTKTSVLASAGQSDGFLGQVAMHVLAKAFGVEVYDAAGDVLGARSLSEDALLLQMPANVREVLLDEMGMAGLVEPRLKVKPSAKVLEF